MIVLAVDPGLSGAVAILDDAGLRAIIDLPTMQDRSVGPAAKVQKKVDGRELVCLLRQHVPAGQPVTSVIEAVRVLPGAQDGGKDSTVMSMAALFGTYRTVETVLECLGWPPEYTTPQGWKRFYGLIDSSLTTTQRKTKALECARRLYPQRNEIARAKDHNRAESLLIAHWYRETRT